MSMMFTLERYCHLFLKWLLELFPTVSIVKKWCPWSDCMERQRLCARYHSAWASDSQSSKINGLWITTDFYMFKWFMHWKLWKCWLSLTLEALRSWKQRACSFCGFVRFWLNAAEMISYIYWAQLEVKYFKVIIKHFSLVRNKKPMVQRFRNPKLKIQTCRVTCFLSP